MPRMDGTGPMGQGPMTGRGFGGCYGAHPVRYGHRLGLGFRRGFTRRPGRMFRKDFYYCTANSKSRRELLEEQRRILERELDIINEELDNLNEE